MSVRQKMIFFIQCFGPLILGLIIFSYFGISFEKEIIIEGETTNYWIATEGDTIGDVRDRLLEWSEARSLTKKEKAILRLLQEVDQSRELPKCVIAFFNEKDHQVFWSIYNTVAYLLMYKMDMLVISNKEGIFTEKDILSAKLGLEKKKDIILGCLDYFDDNCDSFDTREFNRVLAWFDIYWINNINI